VLRRAYRELALLFHPDKNPGADSKRASIRFLEISEAYRALSRPDVDPRGAEETGRRDGDADADGDGFQFSDGPRGGWAFGYRDGGASSFFTPPFEEKHEWSFRYDTRDVDEFGAAEGTWHRGDGESRPGRRDVSPIAKPNPCFFLPSQKSSRPRCVAGRGGAPSEGTPKGHARLVKTRIVETSASRNTASASLRVNHLGLQTLEFRFGIAADPGRAREPRGRRSNAGFGGLGAAAAASSSVDDDEDFASVSFSPARVLVRERVEALVRFVRLALTRNDDVRVGSATEASPVRVAEIAAAAVASAKQAKDSVSGGGDPEAVLAEAFERAIAIGTNDDRDGRPHADVRDETVPERFVVEACKLLAVAAASELKARGDLGFSLARPNAAAPSPESSDPRTARGRASRRRDLDGHDDVSRASFASEKIAASLCETREVARAALGPPSRLEIERVSRRRVPETSGDRFVTVSFGVDFETRAGHEVRPGDVLAYEMKWMDAIAVDPKDPLLGSSSSFYEDVSLDDWSEGGEGEGFFSVDSERSRLAFVALDVETDDGTRLGDTRAVDENGLRAHASSDVSSAAAALGESGWYSRRIAFPRGMVGKSLKKWLVSCERDTPSRVRAGIRNVRVLREDGEEVFIALASTGTPKVAEEE
jgi:curved DNA-binding protein CbpA